jgi:hypothetical protein
MSGFEHRLEIWLALPATQHAVVAFAELALKKPPVDAWGLPQDPLVVGMKTRNHGNGLWRGGVQGVCIGCCQDATGKTICHQMLGTAASVGSGHEAILNEGDLPHGRAFGERVISMALIAYGARLRNGTS